MGHIGNGVPLVSLVANYDDLPMAAPAPPCPLLCFCLGNVTNLVLFLYRHRHKSSDTDTNADAVISIYVCKCGENGVLILLLRNGHGKFNYVCVLFSSEH